MGMNWQISVQSRQLNLLDAQGNHSPQLPISRDKFKKLDSRTGNQFGRPTTGAPPTATFQNVQLYGFLPRNQDNYRKPSEQQPPPSTNFVWAMVTSDPNSYDYPNMTPQDANVQNQFKPPNTFYLVVHYIGRKGKELEFKEKQQYKAYCSLQRVQKP